MKILICDGMEQNAIDALTALDFEVIDKHYDVEELKEAIKDVDAAVVRSATKITKEIIDAALETGRLKVVIRGGVGVDNIDVKYAEENGVKVRNTPNASSISVAELAIGHMFAASRFIAAANVTMREGKWEKKAYEGTELYKKTIGLVGFGRISREVAKRAEALGMKVIYTDMIGEVEGFPNYTFTTLEEVLKTSDFISLHIPFIKSIGAVITDKEFDLMKKNAYLINCARGGVVDEAALIKALDNGKIAGAALDVFESEPKPNMDVVNHPKISVTPHIGAATVEAQERIGEEIVEIIKENLGGANNGDVKAV
ncbi:MAG: D-2-hydroxyacid dehydrogenase [Clostridiaceae bacterium]